MNLFKRRKAKAKKKEDSLQQYWRVLERTMAAEVAKLGVELINLRRTETKDGLWHTEGKVRCPCGGKEDFTMTIACVELPEGAIPTFDVSNMVDQFRLHILQDVEDGILPAKWRKTVQRAP